MKWFVILLLVACLGIVWTQRSKTQDVTIGSVTIHAQVVNTEESRVRGLSGRTDLEKDHGMLFVFEKPDYHGIWMKDMKFSIDILWLDDDYQVVDIKRNVLPESYPTVFKPEQPARYVLEVNAGSF